MIPSLMDLLFRNGVLGAAEGFIRGYWSSEDLVDVIRILARNRDVLGSDEPECCG